MVQGILSNMRVCPGPYIPEPGTCLRLAGAGAIEFKSPMSKIHDSRQIIRLKTGDMGSLESCIGRGDSGLEEYGSSWAGM